jgi:hypothetical protein
VTVPGDDPQNTTLFFRTDRDQFAITIENTGGSILHVPTPQLSGDGANYFRVEGVDSCAESGTIKITAINPPDWDQLAGPKIYATTLHITSDGG